MPLILAIEPDRRQASQLKRLTRGCAADLVLADTTELALEAIGNRIPDLVLVPALLSPQDDAALATALRVIAAAAHVQTLTIPVFAAPTAPSVGGVLAKWRRGRSTAAAEGCDPAVFAEQIAAYLAEAAAAREELAPVAAYSAEIASKPIAAVRPAEQMEPEPAPLVEPEEPWDPLGLLAEEPQLTAEPAFIPEAERAAEEVFVEEASIEVAEVVVEEEGGIDLHTFLAELEQPQEVERFQEVEQFQEIEANEPAAPVFVAPEAPAPEPELLEEPLPEPAPRAPRTEQWAALSLTPHRWPRLDAMLSDRRAAAPAKAPAQKAAAVQPEIAAAPPPRLASAPPPPPPLRQQPVQSAPVRRESTRPESGRPEPARPEWLDMLDALRRDIERLRLQRTGETPGAPIERAQPAAAAKPIVVEAPVVAPRKPKRKKDPAPVQDEWGFFDPQQCGFTALLAKLDEFSDTNQ